MDTEVKDFGKKSLRTPVLCPCFSNILVRTTLSLNPIQETKNGGQEVLEVWSLKIIDCLSHLFGGVSEFDALQLKNAVDILNSSLRLKKSLKLFEPELCQLNRPPPRSDQKSDPSLAAGQA